MHVALSSKKYPRVNFGQASWSRLDIDKSLILQISLRVIPDRSFPCRSLYIHENELRAELTVALTTTPSHDMEWDLPTQALDGRGARTSHLRGPKYIDRR
jgi:hypothetical protein